LWKKANNQIPEDFLNKHVTGKHWLIGTVIGLSIFVGWYFGLYRTPTDANQGEVYRIIYVHVPSAMTAFFTSAILFIASLWGLKSKKEEPMQYAKATAEVGLIFTILCLATGSIWGRPTWGTWWTWDARLTTTLLLAILYCGYLLLYASMPAGPGRRKVCAVLGVLICANVPIIYKSVTWWRTLHQGTDIVDNRGSNMDSTMFTVLLANMAIMLCWSLWLIFIRAKLLKEQDEIEAASIGQAIN
jgi:heme exporter protein C